MKRPKNLVERRGIESLAGNWLQISFAVLGLRIRESRPKNGMHLRSPRSQRSKSVLSAGRDSQLPCHRETRRRTRRAAQLRLAKSHAQARRSSHPGKVRMLSARTAAFRDEF